MDLNSASLHGAGTDLSLLDFHAHRLLNDMYGLSLD